MPDLERHRNAPVPGWSDARMPMPAEQALMPMPSYVCATKGVSMPIRFVSHVSTTRQKKIQEGVAEKALLNESFVRSVQYSVHTIMDDCCPNLRGINYCMCTIFIRSLLLSRQITTYMYCIILVFVSFLPEYFHRNFIVKQRDGVLNWVPDWFSKQIHTFLYMSLKNMSKR
jgi:hypothetical protein